MCLFVRVHDNSQANAVMQQAAVVLQVGSMTFLRRFYDERYISKYCSPLADNITAVSGFYYETKDIKTQIKVCMTRLNTFLTDLAYQVKMLHVCLVGNSGSDPGSAEGHLGS